MLRKIIVGSNTNSALNANARLGTRKPYIPPQRTHGIRRAHVSLWTVVLRHGGSTRPLRPHPSRTCHIPATSSQKQRTRPPRQGTKGRPACSRRVTVLPVGFCVYCTVLFPPWFLSLLLPPKPQVPCSATSASRVAVTFHRERGSGGVVPTTVSTTGPFILFTPAGPLT